MTQLQNSKVVTALFTIKGGKPYVLGVYQHHCMAYAALRKIRRDAPYLNCQIDSTKFYF
jgi:hypothetical protein